MLKKLENVLVKLPLNGDLTVISTAMIAISTQPELLMIPQLVAPLAIVGKVGMLLGLFRKLIKRLNA
jgi:hypothetical protein